MNAETVKALRWVRWLMLLSSGFCTLYVLYDMLLVYAWGPYQACQAGRCYMRHNWAHLLENFAAWHSMTLASCAAVFIGVWRYKVPAPDSTPDPVPEDEPSSTPEEWPVTSNGIKSHQNGD